MLNAVLTLFLVLPLEAPICLAQQRGAPITRAQIKEAGQRLATVGYWGGRGGGGFGGASRQAFIAFQKWEGRSVTGKLNAEELEALRTSLAPKPRDPGYEHVEVDVDRQILMVVGEDGGGGVLPVSTGK